MCACGQVRVRALMRVRACVRACACGCVCAGACVWAFACMSESVRARTHTRTCAGGPSGGIGPQGRVVTVPLRRRRCVPLRTHWQRAQRLSALRHRASATSLSCLGNFKLRAQNTFTSKTSLGTAAASWAAARQCPESRCGRASGQRTAAGARVGVRVCRALQVHPDTVTAVGSRRVGLPARRGALQLKVAVPHHRGRLVSLGLCPSYGVRGPGLLVGSSGSAPGLSQPGFADDAYFVGPPRAAAVAAGRSTQNTKKI
jgi:hypothetical protein